MEDKHNNKENQQDYKILVIKAKQIKEKEAR